MGFIKEFKEFALKGNVIDLAVAVVERAAVVAAVPVAHHYDGDRYAGHQPRSPAKPVTVKKCNT